jgi:hypothetical protein
MKSRNFTIGICGQMRIFHVVTGSGSPSISEPVLVAVLYSDPAHFQTDL